IKIPRGIMPCGILCGTRCGSFAARERAGGCVTGFFAVQWWMRYNESGICQICRTGEIDAGQY
ncbi:MAG: hypothetical protein IJG17_09095, partial [Eubacterium sp.]|nr:hypothetical protein [Eubacterium sp.]